MANMTDEQRRAAWAAFMREVSNVNETVSLSKLELRAAIDATDQWISNNTASYNNALPVAAKDNLTTVQKSRILRLVSRRRFEEGT